MDLKGKIILISNRNVRSEYQDEHLFGDDLNPIAAAEINIALAEKNNKKWQLELVTDAADPNYKQPVSRKVFQTAFRRCNDKPWVLFVHGFNQSLKKNLEKCLELQSYGVNVATFSWPSNPGPQALYKKYKEYKRARFNARRSVGALERTLDKLCAYMDERDQGACRIPVNLVVHSLGNYLFQNYAESADFAGHTRIFSNVLFHQADADTRGHPRWLERVSANSRVYVTINAHDSVLSMSDKVNPDRLGNTQRHEAATGTTYMDFTWGQDVGNSHRPWHKPGAKNTAVADFYRRVLRGERGEVVGGWRFNADLGNYELAEQEPTFRDELWGEF